MDSRKVDASMEATFYDRRKLIVMDSAPLATIQMEYPTLFDAQQVSTKKMIKNNM